MPPRPNALTWLLLSLAILIADQITKAIVLEHFQLHDSMPVIAGLLNWTLAYNEGAAFSFLADAGGWQRWFFTALAVVVSVVLVVWLKRTPRSDWRTALPLSLVIGGAIGNVIDRVRFGHVVDFIDVYYGAAHWPAFNIADSAISVGAVLLIVFGLFGGKGSEASKP
jgi:signal peptidase II